MNATKLNNEKVKYSIVSLTWPIFVEVLLQNTLCISATFMLSYYSEKAAPGVGISGSIVYLLILLFGILNSGNVVLISQYIGAKKKDMAIGVANISLVGNFLFGVILSVVIIVFRKHILNIINVPYELYDYTIKYISIVGGGIFVQAVFNSLCSTVRAFGYTKVTMTVGVLVNVFNIISNYLIIFKGINIYTNNVITGVAFSNVFSQVIGFLLLFSIANKSLNIKFSLERLRKIPKKIVGDILKIGIPAASESISYQISQLVILSMIMSMGVVETSIRTYVFNLMWIIEIFAFSIGIGSEILIGNMVGAGRLEEAKKSCIKSLKVGVSVSFALTVVFKIFSNRLLAMFTHDSYIISVGGTLLGIAILLQPGKAMNMVLINSLRGSGDVKYPVYMSMASVWGVSTVLSHILGIRLELGLIGIFIALILDEWTRAFILLKRWKSGAWKGKTLVSVKKEIPGASSCGIPAYIEKGVEVTL